MSRSPFPAAEICDRIRQSINMLKISFDDRSVFIQRQIRYVMYMHRICFFYRISDAMFSGSAPMI